MDGFGQNRPVPSMVTPATAATAHGSSRFHDDDSSRTPDVAAAAAAADHDNDIDHGQGHELEQTKSNKKKKSRRNTDVSNQKRKCISTACIACRKRKSKCDGALPSCAACASVYGTECIYDPNSDHRRKGVYREKTEGMKAQDSTLKILVEAILNASDDDVGDIVSKIRSCDNLDSLALQILKTGSELGESSRDNSDNEPADPAVSGERDLAGKMGELRIENGSIRFIGGTSHLIFLGDPKSDHAESDGLQYPPGMNPLTTWTRVTTDIGLITHLLNMYFAYHYSYFTTLSRDLFWRDFMKGKAGVGGGNSNVHCSSLLVNSMLALGCHFTDVPGAFGTPGESRTKGDHFFAEAKRLIMEGDEFERPRLVTVQALALMSVREAGCAREATGWVYSGMSFRMAQDIGLNLEMSALDKEKMLDEEVDARRMTFWGCYLFDKCWSNYLGRLPQLPKSTFNVAKFDVFPDEDATPWVPLSDKGFDESGKQPSRTRAAALQLSSLSEISSDLLIFFYHPSHIGRSSGKTAELKKLSELHKRLEEWRKALPREFEASDGQLPNVILMHMFFHLQYIHLFRPFLKYSPTSSPLPSHISPRRICTSNAGAISKLMRLYKKNWNLRQICNIAVYMTHSACTIHLLNLPEKTAKRDFTHGIKHLEEIAEDWPCARRTLTILSVLSKKWNCVVPEDAAQVLQRADEKFGCYSTSEVPSPKSSSGVSQLASDEGNNTGSFFKREQSPPGTQFSQLPVAQPPVPPPSSIVERMGINQATSTSRGGLHQTQQQPPTQQQPLSLDTSLDFTSVDVMGSWPSPMSAATQQQHQQHQQQAAAATAAAQGYGPSATPISPHDTLTQDFGVPQVRKVEPGQGAGLDNGQWLLTDSARWHHNFEGWDIGQSMPGGMSFAFGGPPQMPMAPTGAAAGQQGMGRRPPSLGLDSFDIPMGGEGWLPGLE